jgi:hypothetical protein
MEDWGMEMEALEQERFEADCEMADMEREARAIRAQIKAGRCPHRFGGQLRTSSNAHLCPPDLAAAVPGSFRCGDCGKILTPQESADCGWIWGEEAKALGVEVLPDWARM